MPHPHFASSSSDSSRPAAHSKRSYLRRSGKPVRVLVVEDEALFAMELSASVEEFGGVVVGIASTAYQAIELAGVQEPDVVLMDVRLDGRADGVTAAKEIRERHGTPTIFVTGNSDLQTLTRLAEHGGGAKVLLKPVAPSELADAIFRAN